KMRIRMERGFWRLLSAASETEDPQHEQQQNGSGEGHDGLAEDRAARYRDVDLQDLGEHAAEERPDDPGDEVAEQAEVPAHGHAARQRARDQADEDPDDHLVGAEVDVDHLAFAARSCSAAPSTRLNAGYGWMTSASVSRGVRALIASTSSPSISPPRGVTRVAPTKMPCALSPTSFTTPLWKSAM